MRAAPSPSCRRPARPRRCQPARCRQAPQRTRATLEPRALAARSQARARSACESEIRIARRKSSGSATASITAMRASDRRRRLSKIGTSENSCRCDAATAAGAEAGKQSRRRFRRHDHPRRYATARGMARSQALGAHGENLAQRAFRISRDGESEAQREDRAAAGSAQRNRSASPSPMRTPRAPCACSIPIAQAPRGRPRLRQQCGERTAAALRSLLSRTRAGALCRSSPRARSPMRLARNVQRADAGRCRPHRGRGLRPRRANS